MLDQWSRMVNENRNFECICVSERVINKPKKNKIKNEYDNENNIKIDKTVEECMGDQNKESVSQYVIFVNIILIDLAMAMR